MQETNFNSKPKREKKCAGGESVPGGAGDGGFLAGLWWRGSWTAPLSFVFFSFLVAVCSRFGFGFLVSVSFFLVGFCSSLSLRVALSLSLSLGVSRVLLLFCFFFLFIENKTEQVRLSCVPSITQRLVGHWGEFGGSGGEERERRDV